METTYKKPVYPELPYKKPVYPELRHEPYWVYYEGEGDDARKIITADRDLATATIWAISSHHPADEHEFGLALVLTDIVDSWEDVESSYRSNVESAMEQYMKDNPDGEDGDNA